MECLNLRYTPRFDPAAAERNLGALLVSGTVDDPDLERRVALLADRFRCYCACYPYGLWAPGLVITREMRSLTELYLPLAEIRRAFDHFFAASLRFTPFHAASLVHTAGDWLDALERLYPTVRRADPAFLLRTLLADEQSRRRFIFANFLPARYGGGFGRYPEQLSFLGRWLASNRARLACGVRCLDAACGSGEGTYELAALLRSCGFAVDSIHVHGTTLEPLELFAAAHGYFPHDPGRQAAYRRHLAPLFAAGATEKIVFTREDLANPPPPEERGYDVILCNGVLGGPFLHDPAVLRETVARLAGRLLPGGILLATNRFHGGWKKIIPDELLREIWAGCGLKPLPVGEGVAGINCRNSGPGTRDWKIGKNQKTFQQSI